MTNSTLISKLTRPEDIDYVQLRPTFLELTNYDDTPFILLLGWAGAEDRYLSVYSRIYETGGMTTLRCITPLKTMFLRKSKMPLIGKEIVSLIHNLNLKNRPIYVHCFSNGGSFIYQHFAEAFKNNPGNLKIHGVIFDSAPAKRRLSTFYRALRPIVGGNAFVNIPISLVLLFFCVLMWTWEYIQIKIFRRNIIQFKPLQSLLDEENRWAQHFIYSESDEVVPYQDVEYFANHRKSLGVNVTMERFQNSQHVKHYPAHRKRYEESVFHFIAGHWNDPLP